MSDYELRIDLALSMIRHYWNKHPEQRLGQVMYDIASAVGKPLSEATDQDILDAVLDLQQRKVPPHKEQREQKTRQSPFPPMGGNPLEDFLREAQPAIEDFAKKIENFFRNGRDW